MANNISTKKRIRQSEKRRMRNAYDKSKMRTTSKKLVKMISAKGEKDTEEIKKLHHSLASILDKNARKNVIHWKKAARLKSRMANKVNAALS